MSIEYFLLFMSADSQQKTKPYKVKRFKNTIGKKGTLTIPVTTTKKKGIFKLVSQIRSFSLSFGFSQQGKNCVSSSQ